MPERDLQGYAELCGRSQTWSSYVCLPLGALGLGIYGDSHHWWDNRGFLTNLISSLSSLLFGVPTALFVLGSLGEAQAASVNYSSGATGSCASLVMPPRRRLSSIF
ncbi:hypothetical protein GCM10022233_87500 [Streptomyces shaanxiensis]|uniref:Uncharacterized protein n=1 Tax=Streptomyces shaanxiensis TaxID=653357 RepID=A0ABP7WKB5_9ACTN